MMVDLRAHRLDHVEPKGVDSAEIVRTERRRMRAKVIRSGAAAAVVNDEANI
jgi:hypothetical protein